MSWQNQNVSKKVVTKVVPLDQEEELLQSIPENAIITAHEQNTKTARITYVIERAVVPEEPISVTVKPIKLDRKPIKDKVFEGHLAVVNIADFHLNRKCYADENSHRDYDIQTAVSVFTHSIDEVVKTQKQKKIKRIILNTAGDFLNSDTIYGTTTAGTKQNDAVNWKHAFYHGTALLEYALLKLSNIAPVTYFYVAGNHDRQVGFYLTSWLAARFVNVDSVEVLDNPNIRETVSHGSNVLIFTHGDCEGSRIKNLPYIDPKSKVLLSGATNIEVLSGHFHSNQVKVDKGVRYETLSSACPVSDSWTYESGYGGSKPEITIFYYDETDRVGSDSINTLRVLERIPYESVS